MNKIKVAQIGTSDYSHGNLIWKSIAKQSDIFEIAGYALPENEDKKFPRRMTAFQNHKRLTVDEILNDPTITAVIIETEEIYLTKYALLAAKSGKHIHMEKPGSQSLCEFEKLMDTVRQNNTILHMGYMYRYNPFVMELISDIEKGELGDIISVEAQMNGICPQTNEARQWLATFQGGMMFFLGCHLIDLIFRICGQPDEIIPLNCVTNINGTTSEDFGMAAFKYKNGISFAKTNAAEIGGYLRRQLVVSGSKRTVELKPIEVTVSGSSIYSTKTDYFNPATPDQPAVVNSEIFDRYDNMMLAFASYVCGEKQNPYTYDYELELYKIILKACGANYESNPCK